MSGGGVVRFPDFKYFNSNFDSKAFSYRSIFISRAFTRSEWSSRLVYALIVSLVVVSGWDSMAATRFWRSAMTLSLASSVGSRLFRYCYIAYSLMDSFPNCLVCMVCCWEIRAYFSSCFCYCVFNSSYTVLYVSVICFVNSARSEDFVALSYSNTINLSSIAELLLSMHSVSSVTSLRIPDTSTLVLDAAFLSAVIMSRLSLIPLCISAQYLP